MLERSSRRVAKILTVKAAARDPTASIDMETALDPTCDVIVAYEQNRERLHPDHGAVKLSSADTSVDE